MTRRKARTEIEIGDTIYEVNPFYMAGVEHARAGRPWAGANPHRAGSQRHDDWENGYSNEEGGCHKGVNLTQPGFLHGVCE